MEEIVAALAAQQDELAALLTGLDDDAWARPSACAGWSVADVVLHLAQTNEMAVASAQGRLPEVMDELTEGLPAARDVDDGADKMVARDRGVGAAAIHARWRRSCTDLREALLACQPGDRLLWMVGDLAARTLGTTRLAETWIHTGDVAHGLGVVLEPADRLHHVARLAWRTIPYAFTREGLEPPGPVAFVLTAPSGAEWTFGEPDAPTVVRGPGIDLCRVASRRVAPGDTSLTAEGPDGDAVLSLVRTWA